MKHTRIKIFKCDMRVEDWDKAVEEKVNKFINEHNVVDIIPFNDYIIVRYTITGVY